MIHPARDGTLDQLDLSVHTFVSALCHTIYRKPVVEGSDQSGDRRSEKDSANETKAETGRRCRNSRGGMG